MKFILVYLLFFQSFTFSQERKKDSLIKLIENTNSNDEKSILYSELAKTFINTQIDSAIYFAEKGYQTAKIENQQKGIAKNATILGDFYVVKNQFNKAKFYYNIALKFYYEENNHLDYCQLLMTIANINAVQNNFSEALLKYYECLNISTIHNLSSLTPHLNNNIGSIYNDIEDYKDAEKYLEIAYRQFLEQNDTYNAANTLFSISSINYKLGKKEEALRGYLNIIKVFKREGNWEDFILPYNALAEIYIDKKEYKKAEEYISLALTIINENKKSSSNFRGPILLYKTDLYYTAAKLYYDKNEINKSIDYANKSLKLSYENSFKKNIYKNAKILYLINRKQNKIDTALSYNDLYLKYFEEYNAENDLKKITQLKMQYQFDDLTKKNEIDLIKKEAKNKRNELVYIGISIFAILGIIIFILLYREQKSKTAKLTLNKEKLELEKVTLSQDLEYKNKELTSNMMYLLEKNEFIIAIGQKLKLLKPESNKENQIIIQELINEMKQNSSSKIWEEFEIRFKEVHSTFYHTLNKSYPDLTPNEIKICAFLRLNMTTKDISAITHQSVKSINVARFRLRKKLNIETEENLINFLIQL